MAKRLVDRPLGQIVSGPSLRGDCSEESLIPIARSFQECGLQNPPTVDHNGRVISGHRRVAAHRLLKAQSMLVLEDDAELSEADIIQRQLIENGQRENLKPSEEAAGLRRFLDLTGLPQKEAAGKVGRSSGAVTQILAVLTVPEWIQKEIDAGAIPKSAAYSLSRVADSEEQAALAKRLIDGSMTRDELIGNVRNGLKKSKIAVVRKVARGKAVLADGRSVIVSGEQLTLEGYIEALEFVLGRARRCRTRGIDLSKFLKLLRSESKAVVAPA